MAKHSTRLRSFFDGKRRQCTLTDYRQLKTKANERRMKLMVLMPLSTQPVEGMPEEMVEEFGLMVKEKSVVSLAKIGAELEGAQFYIFSTDTTKTPVVRGQGVVVNGLRLSGNGVEDKRTVDLEFTAYVPWSAALRDWCGDHQHGDFFVEVVPEQLNLEEEPEEKKKGKRQKEQPQLVQ